MGQFKGFFEGAETFLTPKLSWAYGSEHKKKYPVDRFLYEDEPLTRLFQNYSGQKKSYFQKTVSAVKKENNWHFFQINSRQKILAAVGQFLVFCKFFFKALNSSSKPISGILFLCEYGAGMWIQTEILYRDTDEDRERDRDTDEDRERDRDTDREAAKDTDTDRDRDRMDRERDRDTDRKRQGHGQRQGYGKRRGQGHRQRRGQGLNRNTERVTDDGQGQGHRYEHGHGKWRTGNVNHVAKILWITV
jgi:hypothetical protein